MTNYSQNEEQKYILDYFKDQIGTFIDIGSNDGITLSNTRALAEKGWRGIFIEPSPRAFNKLKNLYPDRRGNFYLYNVALADHNGTATLWESGELLKKGDIALVSTLDAEEKKRFESVLGYEAIEVKCYRWKTFYNRLKIKTFDFISLDAEGFDTIILEQMDLTEVKLLCIEHNSKEEVKKRILDYTSKFGMTNIIYTSAENLLIAR